MKARWYCTDCETEIEREEIDRHEAKGHTIRGMLRPERLLANDPWQVGDSAEGDG